MSWIEDVNKLPGHYKTLVLATGVLMPFWFCVVYFKKPQLVTSSPIYVSIALTFCLTVTHMTANYLCLFRFEPDEKDFIGIKFDLDGRVWLSSIFSATTIVYCAGVDRIFAFPLHGLFGFIVGIISMDIACLVFYISRYNYQRKIRQEENAEVD
jgi:hypothetical protein